MSPEEKDRQAAFEAKRLADKAETRGRLRLQLAAGFLGEIPGCPSEALLREECQRVLRWADILIEEAAK